MKGGFDSLIGLSAMKEEARIAVASCKIRSAVFPHTLLFGIGGTGKTALGRAVGKELGYYFRRIEAANFKRRDEVIEWLVKHTKRASAAGLHALLFVDECHRLVREAQEAFYDPMIEFRINELALPEFCLFAATTRRDKLDNSFYGRFDKHWHIQRYPMTDMLIIVHRLLLQEGMDSGPQAIHEIAQRCLGIPRRATKLVQLVRDRALSEGRRKISTEDALRCFNLAGIDRLGLEMVHMRYLIELSLASGKPRGLGGLAASIEEHEDVVCGMIEPVLLQMRFISMTSNGRILTDLGSNYLSSSEVK